MSDAAVSPAAAAAAAAAADAQQPASCGKGSEGGLRNPLEDADIFDTLFHKWGGDDAAEVRTEQLDSRCHSWLRECMCACYEPCC